MRGLWAWASLLVAAVCFGVLGEWVTAGACAALAVLIWPRRREGV